MSSRLKSCPYCGRIHDKKYVCQSQQQVIAARQSYMTMASEKTRKFHGSRGWQKKRQEIRERDHYQCQVCRRNMAGTTRVLEPGTEVHHIVSLTEAWERRLDNDNLILLCRVHHEMAEKGEVDRTILWRFAEEQEATKE